MKTSLIIPTLNAASTIDRLLQSLNQQTVALNEILVIDSQSDDDTEQICRQHKQVSFLKINRNAFDHGGTRDYALRLSQGDFVLFLTQDALPTNERYIEQILRPFQDEAVAMVSGRQIAPDQASERERLTRLFNYPPSSNVKTAKDIPVLGIKTFFASNVCSAYRRSAYLRVGGFDAPLLTNEDLLLSARFIRQGYKVAYCAEAQVFHSHAFTLGQHFARNFNIGVFMSQNASVFQNVPATREGIRMVKQVLSELIRKKLLFETLCYCLETVAKFLGYQSGLHYQRLSARRPLPPSLPKDYPRHSERSEA
jgi:rhamnosyltransferase